MLNLGFTLCGSSCKLPVPSAQRKWKREREADALGFLLRFQNFSRLNASTFSSSIFVLFRLHVFTSPPSFTFSRTPRSPQELEKIRSDDIRRLDAEHTAAGDPHKTAAGVQVKPLGLVR